MKTTIHIKDFFPALISTREAIRNFSNSISLIAKNKYSFDFTDISFVSRSAADELIKLFKNSNINWSFENTNSNIDSIFKAVIKSQEDTKKDFDIVAITKFHDTNELNNYLAAI